MVDFGHGKRHGGGAGHRTPERIWWWNYTSDTNDMVVGLDFGHCEGHGGRIDTECRHDDVEDGNDEDADKVEVVQEEGGDVELGLLKTTIS